MEASGRLRRAVFVDTSAWYALADTNDTEHETAVHALRRIAALGRPLCTTNYVVAESYTLVRVRLGARAAHAFIRGARDSRRVERVFVEPDWEEEAERLLIQYEDQDFSFVDATSFVTMRRLGLDDALAFDQHFLVAGFSTVSLL